MTERVRITVVVDIEPEVDASSFQIVTAIVLAALHDANLYPERITVEADREA